MCRMENGDMRRAAWDRWGEQSLVEASSNVGSLLEGSDVVHLIAI